jgi:beta-lactamase regulating signal transducer with metallopeptidase domain
MMVVAWMFRMVAASALIGVAAWLLERAFRAVGRPRRWAWVAGLAGVLGSPFLALAVPALRASVVESLMGPVGGAAAHVVRAGGGPGAAPFLTATRVVAFLWIVGVLLSLIVYAAGWWRLRSARRAWRHGRVAGESVLVSPGAGPAAIGVLQPAIVVPEWLLTEDASVQRLVVLHEAEHLAEGDHVVLALAPLALVLMPWNVVLWWMVRRLRLAIELDCDSRVLARGVEPSAYGTLLLDVAGRRGVGAFSIALASPRSALEQRIEALSGALPGLTPARRVVLGMAALVCGVLACGVAPTAPIDRVAASDERMAVGPTGADLVRRFGSTGTRWTIDDEPASPDAVRALAAEDLAVVRVQQVQSVRADVAGGVGVSDMVVQIATPARVRANPSEFESSDYVSREGSRSPLRQIRALMNDPALHVVIDGREADRDALRSLSDAEIAKMEVVRQRIGNDVTAGVHIETRAQ